MALVFIHGTQVADALLVGATEHLHGFLVTGAHVVVRAGRGARGRDQFVLLPRCDTVVKMEVSVAVGHLTPQTGHHSFVASASGTEVTGYVLRAGVERSVRDRRLLDVWSPQFLHKLQEDSDPHCLCILWARH